MDDCVILEDGYGEDGVTTAGSYVVCSLGSVGYLVDTVLRCGEDSILLGERGRWECKTVVLEEPVVLVYLEDDSINGCEEEGDILGIIQK